jgi:hypothetical protein
MRTTGPYPDSRIDVRWALQVEKALRLPSEKQIFNVD